MEKNWLIRTKSNHILGPISKKKLQELLEGNSLKAEDEICSGNGFWMFVHEENLLQKYIYGDEPQPFNPVSEAENVLTVPVEMDFSEFKLTLMDEEEGCEELSDFVESTPLSGATEISLPESQDLDYPDLEEAKTPDLPKVSELAIETPEEEEPSEEFALKKKIIKNKTYIKNENEIKKSWLNDKVLFTMGIGLLIIAIMAFYFRKRIIEQFLNAQVNIELINSANAQPVMISSQKKKLTSPQ